MILSSAYSRVAVRPFPLTGEMKRIIQESTDAVRQVVQDKIEGQSEGGPLYTLWDGDVSGPSGDFHLTVEAKMGAFVSGNRGHALVDDKEKKATVHLEVILSPFFGGYKKYKDHLGFWSSLSQLLHHELVHVFDPKVWSAEIHERLPKYIDPSESGNYEEYNKHPFETSAYGADSYYYFKNKKERGVPLSEAVRDYLSGNHASATYREVTKRGDHRRWRDYLTRIYKSAEQAYRDVGESLGS